MPTVPRRPAAQQNVTGSRPAGCARAELFTAGVDQVEVARQLEVSAQAVSVWHAHQPDT